MKKISALAIAVAASMFTLTAAAEGFDGAYVGIYGGKAYSTDKGKEHYDGEFDGWRQETQPDQLLYGLMGGYNWDAGNNIVLGLEADYEGRNNDDDKSYQEYEGVTDTDYQASTRIKQAGSFRARAGYVFNSPFYTKSPLMVYVTAGYAAVDVEREFWNTGDSAYKSSAWQDGWTAGAGAEYLINANFAARIEYRHSDYGTENVGANDNPWNSVEKQSLTENAVRLGATYQF